MIDYDKFYNQSHRSDYQILGEVLKRTSILKHLKDSQITDICIQDFGMLHLKDYNGTWHFEKNPSITELNVSALKNVVLNLAGRFVNATHPSEALSLPTGERCHIVIPPVAERGHIIIAIRKYIEQTFTLEDYEKSGRFSMKKEAGRKKIKAELNQLKSEGRWIEFFEKAVAKRLNIAIAGSMGSGKTVFHKTLLNLVDPNLRVALIQTNKDVVMPYHPNHFHMFYAEHDLKMPSQILRDCLRLTIDIPIIAEIRGGEAWDLLKMINIGHSGVIFTIHSNDAKSTLDRIVDCCFDNLECQTKNPDHILQKVKDNLDLVVYMKRTHLDEVFIVN